MHFIDNDITVQRISHKQTTRKRAKASKVVPIISSSESIIESNTNPSSHSSGDLKLSNNVMRHNGNDSSLLTEDQIVNGIKVILLHASQQDVLAKYQAGELLNRYLYIDCPPEEANRRCKRIIRELNGLISRTQIYSLIQFYNSYTKDQIEEYLHKAPFLTYSHFRQVMTVNDPQKRSYLLDQAIEKQLTVRDLAKEMKSIAMEEQKGEEQNSEDSDSESETQSKATSETLRMFKSLLRSMRSFVKTGNEFLRCSDLEQLVYDTKDEEIDDFQSLLEQMEDILGLCRSRILG